MSWKGFKKAVERLPQRVLSKAGYAEETIDPEFTEYEIQFKLLCEQTKKLADDAVKFKDALTNMLSHQAVFAETLLDLYQPISGSSRGVVTSPGGTTTVTATKTRGDYVAEKTGVRILSSLSCFDPFRSSLRLTSINNNYHPRYNEHKHLPNPYAPQNNSQPVCDKPKNSSPQN